IPEPTLTPDLDAFDLALKALSVTYADAARAAGKLVHHPVAADTLEAIGATLPGIASTLAAMPIYEAALEVERRILRLPPALLDLLTAALALDPVKWRPCPGSQALAFELAAQVDVLGLLGGAGSGKTDVAVFTGLY